MNAYIRAARDLNENISDSLPMTDTIQTEADADEILRVFEEHAQALRKEKDALVADDVMPCGCCSGSCYCDDYVTEAKREADVQA